MTMLPDNNQEVIVFLRRPHHGKTVLASRFLLPYQFNGVLQPAGFSWGGGFVPMELVKSWQPVPTEPYQMGPPEYEMCRAPDGAIG